VATDDALNDRESDPGSRIVLCTMEPLEDAKELACVLRIEADAVVSDEVDDLTSVSVQFGPNCYLGNVLSAGVFEGIGEKVDDHPLQERSVTSTARATI